MGTTYSNCQVRSASQDAVADALKPLLKEPAYVSPSVGGWVGVYPEGGAMDTDTLAGSLSARLSCPIFSWSVYDSDIFFYTLFGNGEKRDEFNSAPDYFEGQGADGGERDDEVIDPARVQGRPEVLLPLCIPGTTLVAIQAILHPASASNTTNKSVAFSPLSADQYLFADHQASDLAELLGMDGTLASLGHEYLEAGETDKYVLEDFRLVGADAAKTKLQSLERKVFSAPKPDFTTNYRDHHGMPALVSAARTCSIEFVRAWLDGGCDVNIAVETSPYRLEQKQEMLTLMGNTELGITVNYLHDSLYENGVTSLMAVAGASIAGASVYPPEAQVEVVRILLDAGADVNARSEAGRTALSEALKMTEPTQHKKQTGRRLSEEVLRQAAERSAQVVEMLRAAGATE